MEKTTLYLPRELRLAVKRAAQARACSEASIIREALTQYTRTIAPPPKLPLIDSGKPDLAERTDELLAGFGER